MRRGLGSSQRPLASDACEGCCELLRDALGGSHRVALAPYGSLCGVLVLGYRGHEGMRAWWETVRGAFDDIRWDLLDVQGSGDRGVAHFRMSGTLGGAAVQQTMWQAAKFREGKATGWAFFRTEAEALEAVGLSE